MKSSNGHGYFKSTNRVVIITGASSGIGRAAAHDFARRGYKLIVTSRNREALDQVVEECRELGGDAFAVVTDVTREEQVKNLAEFAKEKYGTIDIWVNNASVSVFGNLEKVPSADIRRIVETNLMGYMYGARAAISHFKEKKQGILINVSSVAALTGQPYTSAYVATKAAERALGESLNQELINDHNIFVCTVLSPVTDTPIFQHAANYSGKQIKPPGSIHRPEEIARLITDLAENPRKEVFAGTSPTQAFLAKTFTPSRLYDRRIHHYFEKEHLRNEQAIPSTGNLYGFFMDQLSGGWLKEKGPSTNRLVSRALFLMGVGVGFITLWGFKNRRK